ncbi:MAG TPA: ATP-binding cassette domain-containing protein [Alphaproteobacteria bacterium]|nr:ATP-binding cassette domain-containing protein [Alphaproteobacteria bacterium]
MQTRPLLEIEHLSMFFEGITAVDDVSFRAERGRITGIIGPNGAGKTTVFNCITGFYRPSVGRITLSHEDGSFLLERMEGFRIARDAGVGRTFQNIRLFPRMTVLENLLVAQHTKLMRASAFSIAGLLGLRRFRDAESEAIGVAKSWLDKLGLTAFADREAGTLAHGIQRKIEIARAMCSEPKLLCLDEPAAGLNPRESDELNHLLSWIREDFGTGILLIEHDMSVVMKISDHVVVLDHGAKIAEGTPDAVRNDPAVIRAYLGEEEGLPDIVARDVETDDEDDPS